MKILAVTPTFFPQLGGLEQVVLELARSMREHGISMDVAHIAVGLPLVSEWVHGVLVHRIPLYGNRVLGWAPALKRLARGYDLLHVHDPQLLAITGNVRLSCRRIPAVLSTHGGFWHTNRGYLAKRLYEATFLRGSVRHYRRVLASSSSDFAYYRRLVGRVDLCSNGVHVRRFNAVEPRDPGSRNAWIYWGRLSRNKRVDLIIDYAAAMHRRGQPVKLLICGKDFDGLMPELTAQIDRLGMQQFVRFETFMSNGDLLNELNRRSIFITASEHEGFGLTVVEAMAAGLIVVCRDIAPINGFFEHGKSGWSLQFDSSDADCRSLETLLSRDSQAICAMSAAAREAAAMHDWSVAVPNFVRHYRQVLACDTASMPPAMQAHHE
jgi:alpha-1,3-mannosyltransferase